MPNGNSEEYDTPEYNTKTKVWSITKNRKHNIFK